MCVTSIFLLQSLQSKYDTLVRRIDEMDDENSSLQLELSSLVEEKEQLEKSLAESLKHDQTEVRMMNF